MPEVAESNEVSTVAETNEPTEAPSNEPVGAQDEVTEDTGADAISSEKPAEEKPESADDELKRLRRENRKRERTQQKLYGELEVTKAELARRSASPQEAGQPSNTPDPIAVAREIVALERFNDKCNDIAEQGAKAFKREFMPAWSAIAAEIPITDAKTGKATPFFESITDLDDPAAVIHHIGTNPDLIDELADLSGRKLDRRLALIEAELKTKPKVSSAPTPITPIKPRSSAGEPDPSNTDAWMAWRNKTARM